MSGFLRQRFGESAQSFRSVLADRSLRRVQLAWAATTLGGWMEAITIAVFAYGAGGAGAVAIATVIRIVPAALIAPVAGALADRHPRERVMQASAALSGGSIALAALLVLVGAPAGTVFVAGAVTSVAASAFRSAQAAILPSLSSTPEQLAASNAVATTVESTGIFLGPAIGGVLLSVFDVPVTLCVAAALTAASAALILAVRAPRTAPSDETPAPVGLLRETLGGLATIVSEPSARLLVGIFGAQTLVNGALNVMLVLVAVELGLGDGGLGLLFAVIGVGGIVGALGSTALAKAGRLGTATSVGILLWGAPIALIGAIFWIPSTLVLLAALGIGNTLADVAGLTLIQRALPDDVLARVMGGMESIIFATIGLGSLLAVPLTDVLGLRGALGLSGGLLVAVALASWRPVRALEARLRAPEGELELLRGLPAFAPLSLPALEHLASQLERVRIAGGQEVFRQGEDGQRCYIVEDGRFAVDVDGRRVREQGRGELFGEVALLRDVPRTATVTALDDGQLYALPREAFLAAITAHAGSREAAERVVVARLAHARPSTSSI